MPSSRYSQLQSRHVELLGLFQGFDIDLAGSYTRKQNDFTMAYNAFCHAEIEAYLEDSALSVVNKAMDAWDKYEAVTLPIVSLLAFAEGSCSGPPTSLGAISPKYKTALDKHINDAVTQYMSYVKQRNNGIKTENIFRIFLPIGLKESEIDSELMDKMNSLAKMRGEFVHKDNITAATTMQIDPKSCRDDISRIINLISEIDNIILSLENRIASAISAMTAPAAATPATATPATATSIT